MLRLINMIGWDLNLQVRHHIVTATVVSTLFILGFILVLPVDPLPAKTASFFIFFDPAILGLTFVGAIVLMEKAARVQLALSITPSKPSTYVASKIITLSLAGMLSGAAVAVTVLGLQADWLNLGVALALSNVVAVIIGFIIVARAKSMNDLMIRLLYVSLLLYAPLLGHFGIVPPIAEQIMWVIPTRAMLFLIHEAVEPGAVAPLAMTYAYAYLALWIVGGLIVANREYRRSIIFDGR